MAAARRSVTDGDAPVVATKPAKTKAAKTKFAKAKVAKEKIANTRIAKKKVVKKAVATKETTRRTPPTKKIAKVIMPSSEWFGPRESRPPRRSATERLDDPPPADGPLLIARVANAIERELTQIEIIIGNNRVPLRARTEAERRARTLASLARTLSVITQLREKNLQSVADDDDDDAMPHDLDEFRDTLARRLERLIAEQSQPVDGEPEPG